MQFITLVHRWMGVVLCLFFSAWFFSGAVLIYHPFPSLSQGERLAKSPSINFKKIKISPTAVIDVENHINLDRLRLIDVGGKPAYVLHPQKGPVITIGADDGEELNLLDGKAAGRIAEIFSGKSALKIEGPLNYDQWIVPNRYDPYRPFYRIPMQDKKETVFYVSARTGEILQKTEGDERLWNYIGAIIHWIYPTNLRKHWALWDQVVWWISLFGVVTALAGMCLGIARFREAKYKYGLNMFSPYKGWLRTHHVLGLFAGTFILTWIFSGWLSMDHGRLFSKPNPDSSQIQNFRGKPINQAVKKISLEALKSLDDSNEVETFATGGKTFLITRSSRGTKLFKPVTPDSLAPTTILESEVIEGIKMAWPGIKIQSTQKPEGSDIYGHLREGSLPKNTLRVLLDDPKQTWVHIDMESGQIVSVMDKSRRLYRWLFNGLHSLDFPGLANKRPIWDVLILFLLAVGFFFSVTGIVVGWKRLFIH
jgi:hypothetical protein